MNQFWSQVFWGNTLKDWAVAISIIVVTLVVLRIVRHIALSRLKLWSQRTNTQFDDFLICLIDRFVVPFLYILGLYWGLHTLTLSDKVSKVADVVILFTGTYFIVRLIASSISYFINAYVGAQSDQAGRRKQARGIIVLVNILVWVIGILFLVDNLGYNITTIITGLGIGGIAIALATQAILGDLFSYFVIFFDKPFEIGDFIIIGDKMGAVEYVGIKTTRIRSLSGEQLIFSNTDLTNSRVHNYKRMEKRRIVFAFRISYGTPMEKVTRIPTIIKKIIEAQPDTQFDRAHLLSFGDFSFNFEVVYNVLSPDYNLYMDRQQAINFAMMKAFEQEAIRFAYPTQNLIIGNGGPKATAGEWGTREAQVDKNANMNS
ncbi:mechanosensitive ion channel family protein [Paraflavitalea soli]|uniref:Mechanosensitive ion channel family protein n=1 Tax=Paraflavitalea soli TaxID=2315862 RepID=A0A3B7MP53_9BACT|nr:mechanosensitive ion channel domain-containing protein [Paraflavitalea soli]AXY73345.1 mechanosensitive ion channel family protein [Paraflavitalea soli]